MPDGSPGRYHVDTGRYLVSVRNQWMGRSCFLYGASLTRAVARVSDDGPIARVRFEVQRGGSFSGRVLKQDGTPLFGGVVHLLQGDGRDSHVFGVTDADGRFEILGVRAADDVPVRIYSGLGGIFWGRKDTENLLLWEGRTTTTSADSSAEFTVTTADLDLTVVRLLPMWPFAPKGKPGPLHVGVVDLSGFYVEIWLGPADHARNTQPTIHTAPYLSPACQTIVRFPPKERWLINIPDLPADAWLTIGAHDQYIVGLPAPQQQPRMYARSVKTQPGAFSTVLVMEAPRARLSRLFWYGVPSVLVLVVFGTILVKQMRKRRAKETAT